MLNLQKLSLILSCIIFSNNIIISKAAQTNKVEKQQDKKQALIQTIKNKYLITKNWINKHSAKIIGTCAIAVIAFMQKQIFELRSDLADAKIDLKDSIVSLNQSNNRVWGKFNEYNDFKIKFDNFERKFDRKMGEFGEEMPKMRQKFGEIDKTIKDLIKSPKDLKEAKRAQIKK